MDRLPPHSPEMECAVLGCVLMDPKRSIPLCIEKIKTGQDAFYDLRHQKIYGTFIELYDDNNPVDLVSVVERMQTWGTLEEVGGADYISRLCDSVESPQNLEYYLEILLNKLCYRKMIRVCTDVVGRIYDANGETDADTLMDDVERDVLRISESRVAPKNLDIKHLVHEAINDIERSIQQQGQPSGITTGFIDLDRMTDGLHPGEMIVIAGRPSTGKTSLALNIADHVACGLNLPVGIISLEMTALELVKRLMCSRARVNLRRLEKGFVSERDFPKITSASGKLYNSPLHVDDTGGQSILQIRAKARRWVQQHQIKLLLIDYLQLANASGNQRRFSNRQEEVSMISNGAKNLAKELDIPVVILSQLNREMEREKNRRPRLSDLRESGSIEQDADVVAMLYVKDEDPDANEDDPTQVNLYIPKQRNGPTGEIKLTFLKAYTRFESAAKLSSDDVPARQNTPSLPYTDP